MNRLSVIKCMLAALLCPMPLLCAFAASQPLSKPSHNVANKPTITTPKAKPDLPAPTPDPPPPYQAQLVQLSTIMGTLSYMRGLCGEGDSAQWRENISAIINSDAKTPERRKPLIAAFNRGYGGYALTYHSCTDNARLIVARAISRAEQLSRDITNHYDDR